MQKKWLKISHSIKILLSKKNEVYAQEAIRLLVIISISLVNEHNKSQVNLKGMSHQAHYRQLLPGNLQERQKPFPCFVVFSLG